MLMGLIGLPISIALYWLMLRPKKEAPFPKRGILRLVIAAIVSVVAASILSMPISTAVTLFRTGVFSDLPGLIETVQSNPNAIKEMIDSAGGSTLSLTLWSVVDMFFAAGLLEEGLKYLTCRIAIRKEGMIRTWMDAVIAFSFVGITFELIENVAFGAGSGVLNAILRAVAAAHFALGVIMGYFYGKSLVTGKKGYRLLAFFVPVAYHSIANGFMAAMDLGKANSVVGTVWAISYIVAAVLAVIIVIRWQKKGTLDVPIQRAQDAQAVQQDQQIQGIEGVQGITQAQGAQGVQEDQQIEDPA